MAKDVNEAVKWYRKAAEHGCSTAQGILGLCYYKGEGVAKDIKKAVKLWQKVAEGSLAHSQISIGVCFYTKI